MRNFFVLLSMLLAIILLISSMMYVYFSRLLTDTAYENVQSSMEQAQANMNLMLDNIANFTTEMLNDASLSALIYNPSPSAYSVSAGLNRLSSLSTLIPFVKSVYLFNQVVQKVYLSSADDAPVFRNQILSFDSFPDTDALARFQSLQNGEVELSLRTYRLENSGQSYINYSLLTSNWQKWPSSPRNAIMINVSADYLTSMMSPLLSQYPGADLAIWSDQNWFVLTGSNHEETLQALFREDPPEDILSGPAQTGYRITEANGEKALLVYAADAEHAWLTCVLIPYHVLIAPASSLRYTMFTALFALVLSTVFAVLMTVHYANTVAKTEEQLTLLSRHLDASQIAVRQHLLYHIVQNQTDAKVLEKLKAIPAEERPIAIQGWYNVSMIAVDDYGKLTAGDPSQTQLDFMSEISGSLKRCFPEAVRCSSMLMMSRKIIFIASSEEMELESMLPTWLEQGQQKLLDAGISVSVFIGMNIYDIHSVHAAYEQLSIFHRQQIYHGRGSFVMMTAVAQKEPLKSYLYPAQSERNLSNELLKGNAEGACSAYREIIDSSLQHSFSAFDSAVGHLNILLNSLEQKIESGSEPSAEEKEIMIDQFESVEALNEAFCQRIHALAEAVNLHKSSSRNRLIARIDRFVEQHYADSALGIEAIADRLDMSANYVGRTYKQATTKTILDKLLEVRMEHARELLAHSDESVSEIAAKVGFNSDSYFYKMFKQENMMTPAEYRAQYLQKKR